MVLKVASDATEGGEERGVVVDHLVLPALPNPYRQLAVENAPAQFEVGDCAHAKWVLCAQVVCSTLDRSAGRAAGMPNLASLM